jgi:hypothetical protein
VFLGHRRIPLSRLHCTTRSWDRWGGILSDLALGTFPVDEYSTVIPHLNTVVGTTYWLNVYIKATTFHWIWSGNNVFQHPGNHVFAQWDNWIVDSNHAARTFQLTNDAVPEPPALLLALGAIGLLISRRFASSAVRD